MDDECEDSAVYDHHGGHMGVDAVYVSGVTGGVSVVTGGVIPGCGGGWSECVADVSEHNITVDYAGDSDDIADTGDRCV